MGRGQAWLSKIFNELDILSYPAPIIGSTMVGSVQKIFNIMALRRLENAIVKLVFTNIVFH